MNATWFTRTRPDASLEIVGEAYRQELVLEARPPGPGELPDGVPPPPPGFLKALVTPDPANEYDRNAVAVRLWAGAAWVLCGYLSRENAVLYAPIFALIAAGRARAGEPAGVEAIACDAAKVPERGGIGVVLHLGTPGELAAEIVTDGVEPAAHPWRDKIVVFTGECVNTIAGAVLDRPAQAQLAAWAGCVVATRMTKRTDLLVVARAGEMTSGELKAREYGTATVDEVEFLAAIGVPPGHVATHQQWAHQGFTGRQRR